MQQRFPGVGLLLPRESGIHAVLNKDGRRVEGRPRDPIRRLGLGVAAHPAGTIPVRQHLNPSEIQ